MMLIRDTLFVTVCSMGKGCSKQPFCIPTIHGSNAASELTWTDRSDASAQRVTERVSRISPRGSKINNFSGRFLLTLINQTLQRFMDFVWMHDCHSNQVVEAHGQFTNVFDAIHHHV